MRIAQALQKLATVSLEGFNEGTQLWEPVGTKIILEVSGRWISERVSFNSRRVMLTQEPLTVYDVVRIGGQTNRYILYSKQNNVLSDSIFTYDYTVLDETDTGDIIEQVETVSASGMGGSVTENTVETIPIHLVRFGQTQSEEAEFVHFVRLYAFVPNYSSVTTAHELNVGSDRFVIQDVSQELLCKRITLVKR